MTERDHELDKILDPLRKQQPSEFQMRRWKVRLKEKSPYYRFFQILPLAASLALGFFLGVLASKSPAEKSEKKFKSSATKVERFINLE